MTVYVGTSGWQYDEWRPVLYEGVAKVRWLEHFATRFSAVEINNTFYRLPNTEVFASWKARTPDGFRFAVKASRYITHDRRLAGVSEAVTTLVERASTLGTKLGPILYQCPPSLKRDDALLKDFLDALPPHPPATMEFRHVSWFDDAVRAALRERDVALCIADSDKAPAPAVVTASWCYLRLHGGPEYSQYTDEESAAWAERIAGLAAGATKDCYVFFDNDVAGNAVRDADAMAGRLRAAGIDVAPAGAPPQERLDV